jgi:hypothetical protein
MSSAKDPGGDDSTEDDKDGNDSGSGGRPPAGPCPARGRASGGSGGLAIGMNLIAPPPPGTGPADPDLARDLAAAAARSDRSRWCVTVTDSQGHAVGHGTHRRRESTAHILRDGNARNGHGAGDQGRILAPGVKRRALVWETKTAWHPPGRRSGRPQRGELVMLRVPGLHRLTSPRARCQQWLRRR